MLFGEGGFEEHRNRVGYRHSTVAFSANGVGIERLKSSSARMLADIGSSSYSFVPIHELLWELVGFCMVEEVPDELGEDGLELLKGGGLGHDSLNCWRASIERNKRR